MPIEHLRFKPKLLVSTLEDDSEYQAFLLESEQGLRFVPQPRTPGDPASLTSDFGDFAKWVREQSPSLRLSVPTDAPKVLLRNADVWLPLVYLASNTSMQLFLNMAASYLYDKAKGALKNDQPRIHMSAVYQDKQTGRTKRFEFSGDADALAKAIKKFDLNNFFDDGAP